MADILVRRPARTLPDGAEPAPLALAEPPAAPDASRGSTWTYALFPLIGSGGILIFAVVSGNPVFLVVGGVFVLGALGMGAAVWFQTRGRGKVQAGESRRKYFDHLQEVREALRESADVQRDRARYRHPDPAGLVRIADAPDRLWERRPTDEDFLDVRVGCGLVRARAAPGLAPPDPMRTNDPACAQSAERLVEHLGVVPDVPVAVPMAGAVTTLVGDPAVMRPLARAMVAQIAALHAPDDVRIAATVTSPEAFWEWDWLKWLPHTRHPGSPEGIDGGGGDGAQATEDLLLARTPEALIALLEAEIDRRRAAAAQRAAGGAAAASGPALVIVVDGAVEPPDPLDRLDGLYAGGISVLRIVPTPNDQPRHVDRSIRLATTPVGARLTVVTPPRRDPDEPADPALEEMLGAADVAPDALGVSEVETLARRLSPLRLSTEGGGATTLSQVSGLADLLGISDVAELDPKERWAARSEGDLLRVPLGVDADGRPVELDLKEAAQSGMGPHGIAIGATGSGKSELLRTLVSALAMTHGPEDLAFVLVDFKGGATFAGMTELPHLAGMITDLDDDAEMIDRFERALRGELRRREELLRDSGNLVSIREHRRRRLAGGRVEPMPHLLVVVDEFSELLVQQPDLIELFVAIGRLGRSLGVHLLLATQRLEEGRIRGLESHLSYRLALKTLTAQESRTLIGNADAFELPPVPGSAYLKVDTTTYERFRVATVSAPYEDRPTRRARSEPEVPRPRLVWAFSDDEGRENGASGEAGESGGRVRSLPALGLDVSDPERRSTLDVIVSRLDGVADRVHQVWMPPLAPAVALSAVLPPLVVDPQRGLQVAEAGPELRVPMGVVDLPEQQRQELLAVDLAGTGGHLGIAGAPQTGKSSALVTLVAGLAVTHTPEQIQVYGIDLGGGSLGALELLPHVGGVAGRRQPQRVRRLVAELSILVDEREQAFAEHGLTSMVEYRAARERGALPGDGFGDVLLLVDGWMALRGEFEDLEEAVTTLANRGLVYGLHVAVTTARWWDIRPALRDSLGTKIELRIGDPGDSVFDRRVARTMPAVAGRVLVAGDLKGQVAAPQLGDRPEEVAAGFRRVAAAWPGEPARPIRLLPHRVAREELAGTPAGSPGAALGLRERDLRVAGVDLLDGPDPHLIVVGDPGSGKTAALRAVVASLSADHTPEELRFIVVDPRRSLLDVVGEEHLSVYCGSLPAAVETLAAAAPRLEKRLPGPEVTVAQLRARDWWSGPRFVILVDDHDLAGDAQSDPLAPLTPLLAQGRDIGLHVVLARSIGGVSTALSMNPTLRRLAELGTPGLMLSGPRDEGPVLHGVRPQPQAPGRARLVTRREPPETLQVAWTPEPSA